jgi:tetratricopeptide (TPR) repeat protein
MKYFAEIIRILDRFREPRIETVDGTFRSRKEDKSYRLYEGIRNGTFKHDSAAAASLYEADVTDTRYSSLKNRLNTRLLNSLFHLDLKRAGFSESAQAYYTVQKRAFLARMLIFLGARSAGIKMAERMLDLSQRYHFIEVTLEMALLIRIHAGVIGNVSMYEEYDRLLKKTLRIFEAECISWEFFGRAQLIFMRQAGSKRQHLDEFEGYVEQLKAMLNDDSSFTFRLNYYRLLSRSLGVSGKFREHIAACDEAISYLRGVPHLAQNIRLGEFSLQKLDSYTAIHDYEMAEETAKECAALFGYGSNNWFAFAESNFLLYMNMLDFSRSNEFYLEVTQHKRFALQSEIYKEHWMIFELYLHYAMRRMPEYETMEFRKRFDLGKLLAVMPVAAKDKHGLNVALLIMQVLSMLDARNFDGINSRIEALGTYRSRYLTAGANKRSGLFFKLLRIMENNSFSYTLCLKKGERYYQELLMERDEAVDIEQELQILPYEWLWQRVLEKLKEYEGRSI